MPVSYKNIIITPNIGQNADPTIAFQGANANVNTVISMYVYPDSNGTLSVEGSAGQLFSITNDLTGSIFSVNETSGLPLIEVNVTSQQITFGQYYGNVGIGTNASNSSPYKLDIVGSANATGVIRDSKGDVRDIPATDRMVSMPYTITIGDTGKMVLANGNTVSTANVFVPNSVFFTGNTVMITNLSTNNVTVTQNTGVTMFLAGSTSTGNRTLSGKGIATLICVSANNFIISGAGVS